MVRIRLMRKGKNKKPSYRVVVADARSPRDGKFIEIVGYYNPVQQPKELSIRPDRVRYWLSKGAQPSNTVAYLLRQVGVDPSSGNVYDWAYIQAALAEAQYEKLSDGTVYGEIPGFAGVYANTETYEACREKLQKVLKGWIALRRSKGLKIPQLKNARSKHTANVTPSNRLLESEA